MDDLTEVLVPDRVLHWVSELANLSVNDSESKDLFGFFHANADERSQILAVYFIEWLLIRPADLVTSILCFSAAESER
jgi:hypothetical protein